MTRANYPGRRAAARNFPHHVDIPVPRTGLGMRLTEMQNWCFDHVEAGKWEEHAHSDERRDSDGIRIDFCRFYFMDETDAERFRRKWLPDA